MYLTYKGRTERVYVDEGKEIQEVLDYCAISYQDLLHEVNKFAKKYSLSPLQVDLIEISQIRDRAEGDYIVLTYCSKKSKEEIDEARKLAIEQVKNRINKDLEEDLRRTKQRLEELEKNKLNTACILQSTPGKTTFLVNIGKNI